MRSLLRIVALSGPSLAAFAGCSIDARQLHSGPPGGQAGAKQQPLVHAGSGGSAAAVDEAGSAGAASFQPPLVDGCPDLNGDSVGDCLETLLQNGDFKVDIKGWTPDSATEIVWNEDNASADEPSGSALLSVTSPANSDARGSVLQVATQCVAIKGKQLVTVYANALVAGGQAADGHAEVDVYFFDSAACAGTYVTTFSTPQPLDAATTDQWLTLKAGSVSGSKTQSVLVALALSRPLSATSFSARFDNVLLEKQTL